MTIAVEETEFKFVEGKNSSFTDQCQALTLLEFFLKLGNERCPVARVGMVGALPRLFSDVILGLGT
jgi:hypothetical protein